MQQLNLTSSFDLRTTDKDVAKLTSSQRQDRVSLLVQESMKILDTTIHHFVTNEGKTLAGVVGLFSGGNDSTVMCYLMRDRLTHLGHANTTIGIEQTRNFVRQTALSWGIELLEFEPPRESDHYKALVLESGFPGPGHHFKMYQRLKERGLREMRKALVTNKKQRVVFIAGRRRDESRRRSNIVEMNRTGSTVWCSPMVNWTKMDLNTFRLMHQVPVNEVTDLLHMSGECLCGAFAHAGELDEIAMWFPDVVEIISSLQSEIADRSDIPEQRKHWGWGATVERGNYKSGMLCSSCDTRWQQSRFFDDDE